MNQYQTTADNSFTFEGMVIPNDGRNRHYQTMLQGVSEGVAEILPYIAPVTTTAQQIAAIRDAVSSHIEDTAQTAGTFGFDSVLSAVSYVGGNTTDVNVIYGTALFLYREACWDSARTLLVAWQSGGAEPTVSEVIAQLPLWSSYSP